MENSRQAAFRAAWEYLNRHTPATNMPEYWEAAARDLEEMVASLGHEPLAVALLMAAYAELERDGRRSA